MKFLKCRTIEQKECTKHTDRAKRVLIEAIQAKYGDVPDATLKSAVETGMNDGGVVWIRGVRVAECIGSTSDGKVFKFNPDKVTNQMRKCGWEIDGNAVVEAHKEAMK